MMKSSLISALCGAVSAVIVATATVVIGPAPRVGGLILEAALLLPVGLVVALTLLAVRFVLPAAARPGQLVRAAREPDSPRGAAATLAVGATALLFFPVTFRVVHLAMTRFHNLELASLLLSVGLGVMLVAAGVLCLAFYKGLVPLLTRVSHRLSRAITPWIAALFVVGFWVSALVPPLMRGSEAKGVFGFVGLLRLDGLGAGPLVAAIAILMLTAVGLYTAVDRPLRRGTVALSSIAVVLCLVSPFLALNLGADPARRDSVERAGGLGAALMSVGRQLSDQDRDGHGTVFGGQDCDDADPQVHPGAQDTPDNGVDEDCSGADLNFAQLAAAAGIGVEQPTDGLVVERPSLPQDTSLVLITIDAWRADAAGFLGAPRPLTPNLDALAKKGVIYERAYSLASFTGHSVPAMMTGKWTSELRRNAAHEIRVAGDESFAAEAVCQGGVRCGAFLSHFLFKPSYGWHQGFQDWEIVHGEPVAEENVHNRTSSAELTDRAIAWLEKSENTDGRFWLWVHYFDPHREYLAHEGFEKFGDDRRAMYEHEVLFTDHHVSRLLEALQRIGANGRTLVVVTGDHGEGFMEHGSYAHGKELWEELLRVPLLVTGPGVPVKRIDRPTSQIDMFPTILDLFGVAIPPLTHGRSLLPDWVAGQQLEPRPIVADQPHTPFFEMRRSYAKGDYKLIHSAQTGVHHLYRWTGQPDQEPIDTEQPEELVRMKAAYELFVAQEMKVIEPRE